MKKCLHVTDKTLKTEQTKRHTVFLAMMMFYVNTCSVTSVVSKFLRPHGLQPSRLLCPWDFPSRNTGVGCYVLLQGIFLTQGLNPHLLHFR